MLIRSNDADLHSGTFPMSGVAGARWHVAFSVNPSDARMVQGLRNAGYEVCYTQVRELKDIPKRKLTASKRNALLPSKVTVLRPLWPRYPFVRFSLDDGQWPALFKRIGVQGLLCDADGERALPAPIDDAIVNALRALEVDGALPSKATIKEIGKILPSPRQLAVEEWKVGERVLINSGPFSGHDGIIDELPDVAVGELDDATRIRLLVAMFGGHVPVELSLADIQKL
jgi:transcriptional antiterminator NusG